MDDFKTLAAGTFLNDVIINFYLKYLQYDVFSEADRDRYVLLILIYIYFIQNNIKDAHFHHLLVLEALTETKSHRSQKRSSCEEVCPYHFIKHPEHPTNTWCPRHDRVKRWTRKVNIFEKDFVVIPINENYHWYLCIIC